MNEQDVETTDHRASVAAHLQGLGIGMAVGLMITMATGDTLALGLVGGLGLLAVTVGYVVDIRRGNNAA